MPILSSFAAASSRSFGLGSNIIVAGNSAILTSGTSFVLPFTSDIKINVLAIGGGGGGGGGSGRRTNAGYSTGGGGGGAGGNAYALDIPVVPGQTITYAIGAGGGGGGGRDGVYTSGSNGVAGGSTSVTINSTVVALATGGSGGLVAPNATAGAAGATTTGTQLLTPTAGTNAVAGTNAGGKGAKGYTIDTTIGLLIASILGYGNTGLSYGVGGGSSTSGTIYGAGGTGGGCCQSDVESTVNLNSASGTSGAVLIWW